MVEIDPKITRAIKRLEDQWSGNLEHFLADLCSANSQKPGHNGQTAGTAKPLTAYSLQVLEALVRCSQVISDKEHAKLLIHAIRILRVGSSDAPSKTRSALQITEGDIDGAVKAFQQGKLDQSSTGTPQNGRDGSKSKISTTEDWNEGKPDDEELENGSDDANDSDFINEDAEDPLLEIDARQGQNVQGRSAPENPFSDWDEFIGDFHWSDRDGDFSDDDFSAEGNNGSENVGNLDFEGPPVSNDFLRTRADSMSAGSFMGQDNGNNLNNAFNQGAGIHPVDGTQQPNDGFLDVGNGFYNVNGAEYQQQPNQGQDWHAEFLYPDPQFNNMAGNANAYATPILPNFIPNFINPQAQPNAPFPDLPQLPRTYHALQYLERNPAHLRPEIAQILPADGPMEHADIVSALRVCGHERKRWEATRMRAESVHLEEESAWDLTANLLRERERRARNGDV